MATDFCRATLCRSSVRLSILFVAIAVSCGGTPIGPNDEAIVDHRPVNFDVDVQWSLPKSAESASSIGSTSSRLNDAAFDRPLRRLREDRPVSRSSLLAREKIDVPIFFDERFNDLFDGENEPARSTGENGSDDDDDDDDDDALADDDSSASSTKKSVDLPARFVYVAREFYRSWLIPSVVEKSGQENDRDHNDSGVKKIGGLGWRNIIDAPTGDCPPGERRDQNGRCRMTLW